MFKELCINDKKKPWHYHVYKKKKLSTFTFILNIQEHVCCST